MSENETLWEHIVRTTTLGLFAVCVPLLIVFAPVYALCYGIGCIVRRFWKDY